MFYMYNDIDTPLRFDPTLFLDFSSGSHDTLTSHFLRELNKLPAYGTLRVTSKDVGRPDLLSEAAYDGDPQYWFILMWYNSVLDIYTELTDGKILVFPSLADLENLYFTLKALERSAEYGRQ